MFAVEAGLRDILRQENVPVPIATVGASIDYHHLLDNTPKQLLIKKMEILKFGNIYF